MTTSYSDIVKKIKEAVPEAVATANHPEAKLRERVAPIWDDYIRSKRINLNFSPRDERQLANGRADTVFNRLILEYKKPGVIKENNEKNRQLITQVKGYIEDLAKEERWKEERLLGVAFDGNYFLFVRKVGRWIEEEPIPVSVESIERFLLTLEKLTTKAALVPDNLIKDFAVGAGSLNYVASNTIKAFYFALTKNVDPKVKVFFEQWALQFAEVHGAIENKKFDAETLFKSYGFKKDEQKNFNFLAFFFALDTYYGLLMKLLAYQVVGFYTLKNVAGLSLTDWEKLDSASFKDKLATLEEGGIFRAEPLNIRNFLEGDLLSWYLNDWNEPIEKAIRGIIERLNQYDPETMELVPDETRDILKKLYQFLVPKQIRHDLGEYYTPDWLAERCLNQVGYGVKERDLLQKRVLDPGCGSGTFLILAIKRAKEHARLKDIDPAETLTHITKNIVGFDLNPLAVISARTNYLLAVADLLKHKKGELTIPIYLCDSINPPSAKHQDELFDQEAGHYQISTSVGLFRFPEALVQKALIQKVTVLLEDCVKKKQSTKQFLERVHAELKTEPKDIKKFDLVLGETYEKLGELEAKGINGIWARIIKNAFAPLMVGDFDFVIGNPPWVRWQYLPDEYKEKTKHLWFHYGLFSLKGYEAKLGGGEKDISILFTYVSADRYLRSGGRLAFVITQIVFQAKGAGEGFRRFQLGQTGEHICPLAVDDMVQLQPFEEAANKTAVLIMLKGKKVHYPIVYSLWHKKKGMTFNLSTTLEEVIAGTKVVLKQAEPVDSNPVSAWKTYSRRLGRVIEKVLGESPYTAHIGARTDPYGVYWVEILGKVSKAVVTVRNKDELGKTDIPSVQTTIETNLLHPGVRGSDITRWAMNPSGYIVMVQDPKRRLALEETILRSKHPLTYNYVKQFEKYLRARGSRAVQAVMQQSAFYAMFAIGEYTFSPFKLAWRRMGNSFMACVLSSVNDKYLGSKLVIPIDTVSYVATDCENEAHYLCALMNSSVVDTAIRSFSPEGRGFGSPSVIKKVGIPLFNEQNKLHRELALLSSKCHEKVVAGISVTELEEQIDELAAELWSLSKEELKDIKDSLEEMQ